LITLGEGDPFGDAVDDQPTPVRQEIEPRVVVPAPAFTSLVRAEDNQLHLRLHGTGAIAESGQVRALDIEVPVPGTWVGNRRVTLQLRLTCRRWRRMTMADQVVLPEGQDSFKLNEVCKLANVQPYMLRFWGTEFEQLEAAKSGTGQRLYSRTRSS